MKGAERYASSGESRSARRSRANQSPTPSHSLGLDRGRWRRRGGRDSAIAAPERARAEIVFEPRRQCSQDAVPGGVSLGL
jgi:hypothetical protein